MRITTPGVVFLAFLAAGCTHTVLVPRGEPSPEFDRAATELRLRSGPTQVTTMEGHSFIPRNLALVTDSLRWIEGTSPRTMHLGNIAELSYRSTSRGVRDGAMLGALSGIPGLTLMVADDCSAGCEWGIAVLYGGGAGALYGMIAGLLKPSTIRYRFVP